MGIFLLPPCSDLAVYAVLPCTDEVYTVFDDDDPMISDTMISA